jgi:hypothetical protein
MTLRDAVTASEGTFLPDLFVVLLGVQDEAPSI